MEGPGGLACKCISSLYRKGGIAELERLSGNFVAVVFDHLARQLFIVTDRWGLFPAFRFDGGKGRLVYGSHPDALADAIEESRNWDLTSFAEFVLTGKLSPPFTYYQKIQSLPAGSTTTVAFLGEGRLSEKNRSYFQFQFDPQPEQQLQGLAEQFAAAFKQAVARRTWPVLGRCAVALSGGLDSRTVLCAAPQRENLITFSCFDEENRESRIAGAIAREAGARFVPLKRRFDYYGESAALGVKISAGMGCIASNHFLGFRQELRELGVENLLTGCYCDYLFKGLALNRQVNRLTTRERLAPFGFSYDFGHFSSDTDLGARVGNRLEGIFPPEVRRCQNESGVLEVERRRVFPLLYEEDNAERTIPQRVMGWYVPIAQGELLDVALKMSCSMKLNRRLFVEMVARVCGERVCAIPDANTGAPVGAPVWREAMSVHTRRLAGLAAKLKLSNATNGSWLNWTHYARHSAVVKALWSSPTADALDVFALVLGKDGFSGDINAYGGCRVYLFLQLLTLKLWFDQRS